MPKSKGHRFSAKEDREAHDIAKGYEKKGYSKKESLRIGYSTVNKKISKIRNR